MNVGILTLSIHGNYGGVLQNYALNAVLERHGIKASTIDYKKLKHQRLKIKVFRILRNIGGRYIIRSLSYCNPKFAFLYHIRTFADKYIPLTKVLKTKTELEEISKKYDAIIVGSDQVWRYVFIYDDVATYFLDFVDNANTRRIAYAASIGVDDNEYPIKDLEVVRELYPRFDAVSVREKSSVKLINSLWAEYPKAEHVLDPTMLLEADDYRKIICKAVNVKHAGTGMLFYYVLDMTEEKMSNILKVSAEKNLQSYTIYSSNGAELQKILREGFTQEVEQWLSCIDDADFVVTDSFHGCVFCILFSKQFVVYGNKERGQSRFTSLLQLFGLEDRIIDVNLSTDDIAALPTIDYNNVNSILCKERERSLEFLLGNLK